MTREHPLGEAVPILVIATGTDPTHRVRALDNGADDCIGRSFDVDERVARVGAWSRRPWAARSGSSVRIMSQRGLGHFLEQLRQ